MALSLYPDERRDLDALAVWWDVPTGTLAWSVVSDWLSRQRRVSSQVGDVRAALRAGVELALRDAELGPWLRELVGADPLGRGGAEVG